MDMNGTHGNIQIQKGCEEWGKQNKASTKSYLRYQTKSCAGAVFGPFYALFNTCGT